MKIETVGPHIEIPKETTEVGHVYVFKDNNEPYLRCQGGFANLATGAFTNYPDARGEAMWLPKPDAVLVLK